MAGTSLLKGDALGITTCILGANPGLRVGQLEGRGSSAKDRSGTVSKSLVYLSLLSDLGLSEVSVVAESGKVCP